MTHARIAPGTTHISLAASPGRSDEGDNHGKRDEEKDDQLENNPQHDDTLRQRQKSHGTLQNRSKKDGRATQIGSGQDQQSSRSNVRAPLHKK